MLNYLIIDKIIKNALEEDIPYGDITASSVITKGSKAKASLIAKEDGIICGLPVFERVFTILGEVEFISLISEGSKVKTGDIIGEVKGDALNILMGERVALNLLQKMSGIATLTNKYVNELKGLNTKLLDTRKTTANLRILEKYAVKITEPEGLEGTIASVATDGQDYANWATEFTVLQDTEITISLAKEASILVNGTAVEADENGNYVIAVSQETEIVVDKTNAIEDITINSVQNNNVYNLQGILVVKNATAEQVSALPAGLYIINGKKVVLK